MFKKMIYFQNIPAEYKFKLYHDDSSFHTPLHFPDPPALTWLSVPGALLVSRAGWRGFSINPAVRDD